MHLDNSRYPKKCYLQQHRHCEMGRHNWAWEIKKLLLSAGFGYIWYMQSIGDVKLFLSRFKDVLKCMAHQNLVSNISDTFKLYNKITPFDTIPFYIGYCLSLRERRIITLLRTFCLPIGNNLFRMKLASNNICTRCNTDSIDNEFHFLFKCSMFVHIRLSSLSKYANYDSDNLLASLLNSNDPRIIDNCIRFIKQSGILLCDFQS